MTVKQLKKELEVTYTQHSTAHLFSCHIPILPNFSINRDLLRIEFCQSFLVVTIKISSIFFMEVIQQSILILFPVY